MTNPVIICVDDELFVIESLKEQLKHQFEAQYKIETTISGSKALKLFEQYQEKGIDVPLVIADQVM